VEPIGLLVFISTIRWLNLLEPEMGVLERFVQFDVAGAEMLVGNVSSTWRALRRRFQ
jgi:hypothetical protein